MSEDNSVIGGLGTAFTVVRPEAELTMRSRRLCLPDRLTTARSCENLLVLYGVEAKGIALALRRLLVNRSKETSRSARISLP
jgi:deoxyxylulose-5-phosphate synthase